MFKADIKPKQTKKTKINQLTIDLPDTGLICFFSDNVSERKNIIRLLSGNEKLSECTINIDDKSYSKKHLQKYKADVSYIDIDALVIVGLSVQDQLKCCYSILNKPYNSKEAFELLEKVGFIVDDAFVNKQTSVLSKTESLKLAIACALIKKPKILFLTDLSDDFTEDEKSDLLKLLESISHELLLVFTSSQKVINEENLTQSYSVRNGEISFICKDETSTSNLTAGDTEPNLDYKLPIKQALEFPFINPKSLSKKCLLTTLLLSFVFALISLLVHYCMVDYKPITLSASYSNNINYIALNSRETSFYNHGGYDENSVLFTDNQIEKIEEYSNFDVIYTASSNRLSEYCLPNIITKLKSDNYLDSADSAMVMYYPTSNPLNLTRDSRLSDQTENRLPADENEIAITWLQANFFIKYGLFYDDLNHEITDIDQLIGMKLGNQTIVGIYETEDMSFINEHIENLEAPLEGYSRLLLSSSFALSRYLIAYQKEDINTSNIICKLSIDSKKDSEFIKSLDERNFLKIGRYVEVKTIFDGFTISQGMLQLPVEFTFVDFVIILISAFSVIVVFLLKRKVLSDLHAYYQIKKDFFLNYGVMKKKVILISLIPLLAIITVDFLISMALLSIACLIFNLSRFLPIFYIGVPLALGLLLCIALLNIIAFYLPLTNKSQSNL